MSSSDLASDVENTSPEVDYDDSDFQSPPTFHSERDATRPGDETKVEILNWDERSSEERFRHAVILGDPGIGKSWLLRNEFRRLAERFLSSAESGLNDDGCLLLPVFIRLPDLARAQIRSGRTIPEAVLAVLRSTTDRTALLEIKRLFAAGRIALLLDAWDEAVPETPGAIDQRAPLAYALTQFAREYQGRIVLTSRSARYSGNPLGKTPELEILAFGNSEVKGFADAWFRSAPQRGAEFLSLLRAHRQIEGLARIPLLLTLMCRLFQDRGSHFPRSRARLYERALRGLLFEWHVRGSSEFHDDGKPFVLGDIEQEDMLDTLEVVAANLFPAEEFTGTELRVAAGALSVGRNAHRLQREVNLWVRHGILLPVGEKRYMFLHRTIHEYLAARHLAKQSSDVMKRLFDRRTHEPAWYEVLILTGCCVSNLTPILEVLSREFDRGIDLLLRPRLALAGHIVAEHGPSVKDNETAIKICLELWKVWAAAVADRTHHAFGHALRALGALVRTGAWLPPQHHSKALAELAGEVGGAWGIATAMAMARNPKCSSHALHALHSLIGKSDSLALSKALLEFLSEERELRYEDTIIEEMLRSRPGDKDYRPRSTLQELYEPTHNTVLTISMVARLLGVLILETGDLPAEDALQSLETAIVILSKLANDRRLNEVTRGAAIQELEVLARAESRLRGKAERGLSVFLELLRRCKERCDCQEDCDCEFDNMQIHSRVALMLNFLAGRTRGAGLLSALLTELRGSKRQGFLSLEYLAEAVGECGPSVTDEVPQLLDLLSEAVAKSDSRVIRGIEAALNRLRPDVVGANAIPALARVAADRNKPPQIRLAAAEALGRICRLTPNAAEIQGALTNVLMILEDPTLEVSERVAAVRLLGMLGQVNSAVPGIRRDIATALTATPRRNRELAEAIANALDGFAEFEIVHVWASQWVTNLRKNFRSSSSGMKALDVLAKIRCVAVDNGAVASLAELVIDCKAPTKLRERSITLLGIFGSQGCSDAERTGALNSLTFVWNNPEEPEALRRCSAEAIIGLYSRVRHPWEESEAIGFLSSLVNDQSAWAPLRRRAAQTLAEFGDALTYGDVRRKAVLALDGMRTDENVNSRTVSLSRKKATEALIDIGNKALNPADVSAELVAALRGAMQSDNDVHLQQAATRAVGRLARTAIDSKLFLDLFGVMQKRTFDRWIRETAAEALGEVGFYGIFPV